MKIMTKIALLVFTFTVLAVQAQATYTVSGTVKKVYVINKAEIVVHLEVKDAINTGWNLPIPIKVFNIKYTDNSQNVDEEFVKMALATALSAKNSGDDLSVSFWTNAGGGHFVLQLGVL